MSARCRARLVLSVVALGFAAACGGRLERAERSDVERFAEQERRVGLLVVETCTRPGDAPGTGDSPEILRVRRAPGSLPWMRDRADLGGRIELLDRRGRVLWSMGYRPAEAAATSERQGEASPRCSPGPTLRVPLLADAVRIRLQEPGRERQAEAAVPPAE